MLEHGRRRQDHAKFGNPPEHRRRGELSLADTQNDVRDSESAAEGRPLELGDAHLSACAFRFYFDVTAPSNDCVRVGLPGDAGAKVPGLAPGGRCRVDDGPLKNADR
jgi:hypothetical protein